MTSPFTTGRTLILAILVGGIAGMARQPSVAAPGEWRPATEDRAASPLKNRRLRQQPRPESAPVSANGDAVALTGEIESLLPRQPRPVSAPTRQ